MTDCEVDCAARIKRSRALADGKKYSLLERAETQEFLESLSAVLTVGELGPGQEDGTQYCALLVCTSTSTSTNISACTRTGVHRAVTSFILLQDNRV